MCFKNKIQFTNISLPASKNNEIQQTLHTSFGGHVRRCTPYMGAGPGCLFASHHCDTNPFLPLFFILDLGVLIDVPSTRFPSVLAPRLASYVKSKSPWFLLLVILKFKNHVISRFVILEDQQYIHTLFSAHELLTTECDLKCAFPGLTRDSVIKPVRTS